MSSESIPLNHSGKSVIFIMHEVLRADEFKGVGMRIREGFQQNHSFSTSGKGKIVSWNRPPLGFKVGLRHLSFHCALLVCMAAHSSNRLEAQLSPKQSFYGGTEKKCLGVSCVISRPLEASH
jgi:hypothetical protein